MLSPLTTMCCLINSPLNIFTWFRSIHSERSLVRLLPLGLCSSPSTLLERLPFFLLLLPLLRLGPLLPPSSSVVTLAGCLSCFALRSDDKVVLEVSWREWLPSVDSMLRFEMLFLLMPPAVCCASFFFDVSTPNVRRCDSVVVVRFRSG